VSAIVKVVISITPVFIFLIVLILLDSFKLVRLRMILQSILAGSGVALVCLVVNGWILNLNWLELSVYSRSVGPIVEEILKALYIVYFIRSRRLGFMVDAAILGFAVGSGFAFVENIHYLHSLGQTHLAVWIIRGFGTAIMHGGTTCIFAVLSKTISERRASEGVPVFLPGLAAAVGIHASFNQFLLPFPLNTVVQLTALPVLMAITFIQSERSLKDWLEVGLDTDVRLLEYITTGTVSGTRAGRYLESLKSGFPGQVVADMLCMLRIHLELAIRAKGILMMRETGFQTPPDPEIRARFAELSYLEKSIGRTGKLAMAPILHNSSRDLWQIYMLQSE
jgi:RsiW-degrading membrane proteinase PrsW (M82 family)